MLITPYCNLKINSSLFCYITCVGYKYRWKTLPKLLVCVLNKPYKVATVTGEIGRGGGGGERGTVLVKFELSQLFHDAVTFKSSQRQQIKRSESYHHTLWRLSYLSRSEKPATLCNSLATCRWFSSRESQNMFWCRMRSIDPTFYAVACLMLQLETTAMLSVSYYVIHHIMTLTMRSFICAVGSSIFNWIATLHQWIVFFQPFWRSMDTWQVHELANFTKELVNGFCLFVWFGLFAILLIQQIIIFLFFIFLTVHYFSLDCKLHYCRDRVMDMI